MRSHHAPPTSATSPSWWRHRTAAPRRRVARRPAAADRRRVGHGHRAAANDDGDIEDVSWSPDSAWLAWAQPGPQPLARIRLARAEDGFTVNVTDGRFVDSDPVFTLDGLYLAFLSRRTFDPVYDAHSFDLSFPFGARPYLVPLAAHTLSPFGPAPAGRPVRQWRQPPGRAERSGSRGHRPDLLARGRRPRR